MKTNYTPSLMFDVGCAMLGVGRSTPKTILHPPPVIRLLLPMLLAAGVTITCQAQTPPTDDFNPGGVDDAVNSLAVQADGKVLLGGSFFTLGGQTRVGLGRVNADGKLDTGFNPGAGGPLFPRPGVHCLVIQADGKFLVGGYFTTLAGQTRNHIGRLNADGTLDIAFNPGADERVYALAVQPDGKILVGGDINTLGGQARSRIGRLNADGTLDGGFNPGASGGAYVDALALQTDGKILVGGQFTTLGGQARNYIGRLNSDGTLDTTFNPGASSSVHSFAVQADGRILVGGEFSTLGGQTRRGIGRLNADGSVDTGFDPGANGSADCLTVQADGKILVGGGFTMLGGQTRNRIGRLNADGSLDTGFNPGANAHVRSMSVQPDGKILVAGQFTSLSGKPRDKIGRLNNTEAATQSLAYEGSTLTWLRGGTSPEVWRTTFDISTNGMNWVSLGAGARIAGGWQLTDVSLPPNATVRARGYVSADSPVSGWFAETMLTNAPVILTQPLSRTNAVGTTASFAVTATAATPLSYQWRKDGIPLLDGGNRSGVTSTNLVISSVQPVDAGAYTVLVTNLYGSVTSSVAQLTVVSPGRFTDFDYSPGIGSIFIFRDASVGWPYRIQISMSLTEGSWFDWHSFTYNGPIGLMDIEATGAERRFYRAVSP